MTPATAPTFESLAALEPRLLVLRDIARNWPTVPRYCELAAWRQLKRDVVALVGFDATVPELATSDAYDLGYQTIYQALPRCTHNGECW